MSGRFGEGVGREGKAAEQIPAIYTPERLRIDRALLERARQEIDPDALERVSARNQFARITGVTYPREAGEPNQDAALAFCNERLFAAAAIDGMGGHVGGREASQALKLEILEALRALPADVHERGVIEAIQEATRRARQDVTLEDADATIALVFGLVSAGGKFITMHAGDSRVYKAGSELKRLTLDHSPVEEAVSSGEVGRLTAQIHPRRNEVNLGALSFGPGGEPPYTIGSRREGSSPTIILTTDGFHDNFFEAPLPGGVLDVQENGGLARRADPFDMLVRARARGYFQDLRTQDAELSKKDDITILKVALGEDPAATGRLRRPSPEKR